MSADKLAEAVKAAIESTTTLEGLAEALRKALHEAEKQEPDADEPALYQYRMRRTADEAFGPWCEVARSRYESLGKDPTYKSWEIWRCEVRKLYTSPQQEPDRPDAERWRAIKPLFRVMSANIDGNHSWVLASSSWLKGGSMEEAADRIIDAAKEDKP